MKFFNCALCGNSNIFRLHIKYAFLVICVGLLTVAGCGKDSRGWPYGRPESWNSPHKPYKAVTYISVSPNGKYLAAANFGGRVTVYGVLTGLPLRTITKYQHPSRLTQVEFLDDSTLLAAFGDGYLRAIHPLTGKIKFEIASSGKCFVPFAISRDKKLVASIEGDEKIYIWSLKTEKLVRSFPGPRAGVQDIIFSPDGMSIYTSTNGGNEVARWGVHTGRKLWQREAETYALALSPDGKYLAMRRDNAIELWDTKNNRLFKRLSPTEFGIGHFSFAFSPDGKLLAGAELGGDVVIWEVVTGAELADFDGPVGDGLDIVFSPNGKKIFAAGYRDSTVRMWLVPEVSK